MSVYLSPDELYALTGRRQRPSIAAWLRAHRWRFQLDADGNPRVARAYWQRRMVEDAGPEPAVEEPDFAAMPPLR